MADIVKEVDGALFDAIRACESVPSTQFLILFNTEARNEFMRAMTEQYMARQPSFSMDAPYRGAILSVTHQPDMPRVSVFSRPASN